MMSEWKEVQFSELCTVTRGASPRPIKDFISDEGMPWVKIADATSSDSRFIEETKEKIKLEGVPKSKSVYPGDLILSNSATPGLPKFMKIEACIHDGWMLLKDFKGLDKRFAYWLLLHERKNLVVQGNGSVFTNLKTDILKNHIVKIPAENKQIEIAEVLDSVQEKIELNRQTNQTLEQIAQAIFKSWFVDFEPVKAKIAALEAGGSEDDALLAAMQAIAGSALFATDAADTDAQTQLARLQTEHPEQYTTLRATAELFPAAMQDSELGEIPEGWVIGCLADLLDFNPRRTLKKGTVAPYLDMKNVPTSGHLADEVVDREMGSGTKFINGDTLLARITPCLENGKTAYVDFLDEGQVGWGSTEYIVIRPRNDYPTSIGYLIARNAQFRQHAIQSMTGTSGRQRANAKALAELPWVIYPKNIMHVFDKVAGVYLELAKNKGDEAKALSEIRDTLLPKLLSGELSVSDAAGQIPKAEEAVNVQS